MFECKNYSAKNHYDSTFHRILFSQLTVDWKICKFDSIAELCILSHSHFGNVFELEIFITDFSQFTFLLFIMFIFNNVFLKYTFNLKIKITEYRFIIYRFNSRWNSSTDDIFFDSNNIKLYCLKWDRRTYFLCWRQQWCHPSDIFIYRDRLL